MVNTVSVIYRVGNALDDGDMDASEARTRNIRLIVEAAGGPTSFANQHGHGRWTQAQVSQWISDTNPKSIGGRLARDIEAELGLKRGALDQWRDENPPESEPSRPMSKVSFLPGTRIVARSDELEIPHFAVRASMGGGAEPAEHLEVVRQLGVNVADLRKSVGQISSPQNLSFITGKGDSMEPTYRDGDILLIDTGIRQHDLDAIYVLYLNDKMYIKTLQRQPDGSILMISDNPKYKPYEIKATDQVDVQGRVILAWNARRL